MDKHRKLTAKRIREYNLVMASSLEKYAVRTERNGVCDYIQQDPGTTFQDAETFWDREEAKLGLPTAN